MERQGKAARRLPRVGPVGGAVEPPGAFTTRDIMLCWTCSYFFVPQPRLLAIFSSSWGYRSIGVKNNDPSGPALEAAFSPELLR